MHLGLLSQDPAAGIECFRRSLLIDPEDGESRRQVRQWNRIGKGWNSNLGGTRLEWSRQAYYRRDYTLARLQLALAQELDLSARDLPLAKDLERHLAAV